MQKAKIIVAVRKRPLFQKQKIKGFTDIIAINNGNRVIVSEMKQKVDLTKYMEQSVFNFDHAFDQNSTNEQIYSHIISPLIDSAFEGAKVSCFAYGQTGSGKTYTMNGVISKNLPGLYTLGAYDIFQKLQKPQFSHLSVYLSFYQIYCTKLYDLLNKRNQLILRQDAKSNINVVGLSEIPISNVDEFQNYLKIGSAQRVTSQNSANSESSRSHAILQITLKNGKKGHGKVYFIDLAGNQRGADHMNQKKQTQIDGQQINKSLLQLKQCIRGLDQGKNHVPFRGSKLTMCLKDSFIGFCRTVMIGNISPSSSSSQNTLNTLRYADRVKQLKNNEELSKEELKNREMMLPRGNNNAIKIKISNSDDEDDIAEKKRKALQAYGIKQEQKVIPPTKEENIVSNRKLSVGPANTSVVKPVQVDKSSSIAKNPVNSSVNIVSNKQIPLQRNNQVKMNERRDPYSLKNQVPQYLNQYRSNQVGMRGGYNNGEPMEIERPQGNQGNGFENNIQFRNNYNQQFVQNNSQVYPGQQQHYQQSHYISQNNFINNNSRVNSNPLYPQNDISTLNVQRQNNMAQNYQDQDQQNNFNRGNNRNLMYQSVQQNNFMQMNNSNLINQQNYQNYQQTQKITQIQRPPVPENWNEMIDCIQNTRELQFQDQVHEKLVATLFQQQNLLISEHSNTLQSEIQKIKQEMQVIKLLEHDRSSFSSKQYTKIMYDSIDDKIGQLEMLKQKLTNFMYKLDDIEEVEKKIGSQGVKKQSSHEDEQLLEDYY